jgi:hypothetical protein
VGSINGSLKDQGNEVNLMNVTAQKQIVPNKVLVTQRLPPSRVPLKRTLGSFKCLSKPWLRSTLRASRSPRHAPSPQASPSAT